MQRAGVDRNIKYSFWVRAFFTIGLLVLVYSKIDFFNLVDRLSMVGLFQFFYCCFLYSLGQFLSAFKWKQLLNEVGLRPQISDILKAYFLGMFINSFGLGTVGGDVARVFSLKCEPGKRTGVFTSVIADRMHGLIVLSLIGVVSLLVFQPAYVNNFIVFVSAAFVILFLFAWFVGPLAISRFLPSWIPKRDKIQESMLVFPKRKEVLIKITIISFLFHSVQIYLAYFIFQIIDQKLDIGTVLTSIPFVNVASALPISINGIGVRESVSVYLLGPAGITNEASVAFAALWVLVVTLVSGFGGLAVIPGMGEGIGTFLDRIKKKD